MHNLIILFIFILETSNEHNFYYKNFKIKLMQQYNYIVVPIY